MEQEKRKRGANAMWVIPIFAAFAALSRIGDVRTVDFLRIFAAGMLVGVMLTHFFLLMSNKKKTVA
ncbi:MAG TPA: hypothetical protein VJS69_06945 [Candidatus Krumholzibacteria bacterium]|nr:hypothetical protein [Candidatus Krumholzibacteria bacterium]